MNNHKTETNKTASQPTTDTQKRTEELRTKAFRIALEMVAVFGGPAILALLLGRWLEGLDGWPDWITYALLAVAFIISWVIVLYRVRSLSRELEASKSKQKQDDTSSETDKTAPHNEDSSHSE